MVQATSDKYLMTYWKKWNILVNYLTYNCHHVTIICRCFWILSLALFRNWVFVRMCLFGCGFLLFYWTIKDIRDVQVVSLDENHCKNILKFSEIPVVLFLPTRPHCKWNNMYMLVYKLKYDYVTYILQLEKCLHIFYLIDPQWRLLLFPVYKRINRALER